MSIKIISKALDTLLTRDNLLLQKCEYYEKKTINSKLSHKQTMTISDILCGLAPDSIQKIDMTYANYKVNLI